mmetsp:Transcript_41143/g.106421  ORF Transcript_41143/g.106421 Transcript_41143/m.106421 type:complete len:363 (+) Transcript_41143:256-1344(+)
MHPHPKFRAKTQGRRLQRTLIDEMHVLMTAAGRRVQQRLLRRHHTSMASLRRDQREHHHLFTIEPLRHVQIAVQRDHGEADEANEDCHQKALRDIADLALVERQHEGHEGAGPRQRVVGGEEHLRPPGVDRRELLDPRLTLQQQVQRHGHVEQQRGAHGNGEALAQLAAAHPAVDDEDGVKEGRQRHGREERVEGHESRRVVRHNAQTLVRQDEIEHRGVHEACGPQVAILAKAQELLEVLEGARHQGRLQARDRIDGTHHHGCEHDLDGHMRARVGRAEEPRQVGDHNVDEINQADARVRYPRDGVDVQGVSLGPHAPAEHVPVAVGRLRHRCAAGNLHDRGLSISRSDLRLLYSNLRVGA